MPLGNLLRVRDGHGHTRVTFVELFFDLVFVFAVTQLSHSLLADLTLSGALHTALLLVALWWVWIDTSWVTNWLDPDRTPVRLALFVIMLLGLTLSAAIPEAFAERGLVFAAALVTIQVGRSIFFIFAVDGDRNHIRNFQRITAWLAFAGVFWIAGGLAEGETRVSLWLIAVVIECIAPATAFWTPGLGRSSTTDWTIEVDHMAERCGLFIIIALGESILVTGATFSELEWTAPVVGAFLGSFVGSVAMWWIYFTTAEAGTAVASSFERLGTDRALRLHLHAYSDRRRDHRHRRRRRTGSRPPGRTCRAGGGRGHHRRSRPLSDRDSSFQMVAVGAPFGLAPRRTSRACRLVGRFRHDPAPRRQHRDHRGSRHRRRPGRVARPEVVRERPTLAAGSDPPRPQGRDKGLTPTALVGISRIRSVRPQARNRRNAEIR